MGVVGQAAAAADAGFGKIRDMFAGQQVQKRQAVCDGAGARGIARALQGCEKFSVSRARCGVAIAIQELGVRAQNRDVVGFVLSVFCQRSSSAGAVARRFHFPDLIEIRLGPECRGER